MLRKMFQKMNIFIYISFREMIFNIKNLVLKVELGICAKVRGPIHLTHNMCGLKINFIVLFIFLIRFTNFTMSYLV
jgi:hypothetical protein